MLTAARGVGWMTVDGGDDSRTVTDEGTFFIRMAILTLCRFYILDMGYDNNQDRWQNRKKKLLL